MVAAAHSCVVLFHKCSCFYIPFLCDCLCCHCRSSCLIFEKFSNEQMTKRNEANGIVSCAFNWNENVHTQKQIIQYTIYSWYRSRVLFLDDDGYTLRWRGERKKKCGSNLVYCLYLWLVRCVKAIHTHECDKHQPFFIRKKMK